MIFVSCNIFIFHHVFHKRKGVRFFFSPVCTSRCNQVVSPCFQPFWMEKKREYVACNDTKIQKYSKSLWKILIPPLAPHCCNGQLGLMSKECFGIVLRGAMILNSDLKELLRCLKKDSGLSSHWYTLNFVSCLSIAYILAIKLRY